MTEVRTMSGAAEDLFGDSSSDGGDTDDLLAEAGTKPVAKKKGGRLQKKAETRKRDIPDADDSDDDDGGGGGGDGSDDDGGLFDSDDSDDESPAKKSKKLKKKKDKGGKKKKKDRKSDAGSGKKMSKKEKMEAMAKRRRMKEQGGGVDTSEVSASLDADASRRRKKDGGEYDSEDSYASREFVRTKEDDDFIDDEDEDPEALRELYREQHFDDERPDGSESEDDQGRKLKKKNLKKSKPLRKRGPDALSDDDLKGDQVPDNPILAAVHKMKRKKKDVKKLSELEDEARAFVSKMEKAADQDDEAIKERRPATAKLIMLPEVLSILARRDIMRPLLDFELLNVSNRWLRPLRNGSLGNITVRQKLLQAIGNLTGENGIRPEDLKRSGFGKTVMVLYKHKSETPELKRQHKALIDKWSRSIFQKSGNMHDLEKAQAMRRGGGGLLAYAQAQAAETEMQDRAGSSAKGQDLSSVIAQGTKSAGDIGNNRVRVPYSKGFRFTVRPNDRVGDIRDNKTRISTVKGQREGLHKRMIDKNRPINKNQRSANISIEGRAAK
uniref:TFIIS N-terminal domain-containing protein n=1 Tax=Trieres chinensis TaxID=1514140 RepID=A0A7S2AA44_TRICV